MVMVGRLGALPLAAAGLGGMLYFTVGVVLQGILFAVAPLAAHALGAGDRAQRAGSAAPGWRSPLLLALPFVAALTSLDRLLRGWATMPRSPPRSAAFCGRSPGVGPLFSALRCCAACLPRYCIRAR